MLGWMTPAGAQSMAPDDGDLAQPPALGAVAPQAGDATAPRRHERVANAAALTDAEASAIYGRLVDEMAANYRRSGLPLAAAYRHWRRFNTVPYRSATHGRRYVNNYVNPTGAAYGDFEAAGRLPEGSVVVKDSFTVDRGGHIAPGPMFVMEKMARGFNYVSGDWRYSVIAADGHVLGATKGANAAQVDYCVACHLAREAYDHLYFPPAEYRVRF